MVTKDSFYVPGIFLGKFHWRSLQGHSRGHFIGFFIGLTWTAGVVGKANWVITKPNALLRLFPTVSVFHRIYCRYRCKLVSFTRHFDWLMPPIMCQILKETSDDFWGVGEVETLDECVPVFGMRRAHLQATPRPPDDTHRRTDASPSRCQHLYILLWQRANELLLVQTLPDIL